MRRLLVLAAVLATTACSGNPESAPTPTPPPTQSDPPLVRTTSVAMVIDKGDGPVLCGGVNESLPPQCGGPPITGWDWEDVHFQEVSGVRWGQFTLTGRWDGETLALVSAKGADPELTTSIDPDDSFRSLEPARQLPRRQLRQIAATLVDRPGVSGSIVETDNVEVSLVYDDGSRQARLDRKYGAGVVNLSPQLVPVEP